MDGNLSLPSATYYCEYSAEYMKNILHTTPFVSEQACGYWFDFPKVYAPELYIWNIWTVAAGHRGFNMYLWSSGRNREGLGAYGTNHNWQAPVGENGERRPSFTAIQKSLTEIKDNQNTFSSPGVLDLALGVKREPGLIGQPVSIASKETYYALKSQGFLPKLVDFTKDDISAYPVLAVVTDRWMAKETQQKLFDYVTSGGKLLLLGCLPTKDEKDHYCHVLADGLGVLGGTFPKRPSDQEKVIYEGFEYYIGKTIQNIDIDKTGQVIARTQSGRAAVILSNKGKGSALVFPVLWHNAFVSQSLLLKKLLALLGAQPTIEGQNLLRALPKENGRAFILNLHPVPVEETLTIGQTKQTFNLAPYSYTIQDWKK